MTASNPRKLAQDMTVQHVGPEILVYDERRHQAFCLNATSAAVWNLADGTRTPAQIAAAATLALAAPVAVEVVDFALAELGRDGLLETAPAALSLPTAPAVSRRVMMQSLGASSVLLVPVVAAILAPKAAQAYGGCFDCSNSIGAQRRMQSRAAAAQAQAAQKLKNLNGLKFGN